MPPSESRSFLSTMGFKAPTENLCENCGEPFIATEDGRSCPLCTPPSGDNTYNRIATLYWLQGYVAGLRFARKINREKYDGG